MKRGPTSALLLATLLFLGLAASCGEEPPACPTPERVEQPVEAPQGTTESQGGEYTAEGLTFLLPENREYRVGTGVSRPGSTPNPEQSPTPESSFVRIYDVATSSTLDIGPSGCELKRQVGDPDVDPVFDSIMDSLETQ